MKLKMDPSKRRFLFGHDHFQVPQKQEPVVDGSDKQSRGENPPGM